MKIFGYIKVGKRISKAHKDMFTDKTMVLWYKGRPIIGTMHDGLWYQQDLNGNVGTINVPVRSYPRIILTFTS